MKHYTVEPIGDTFEILCGDCQASVGVTDIKHAHDPRYTAEDAVHQATQDMAAHILQQELDDLLAHWSRNLGPVDPMEELEVFWTVLARATLKSFGKPFASAYLSALLGHIEHDARYTGFINQDNMADGETKVSELFNAIDKGPPFRNDEQDAHGGEATKPDMKVVAGNKEEP